MSEERLRVIELLGALTASSDLVEQQRCQIADLHRALQQQQVCIPQAGNTDPRMQYMCIQLLAD